MKLVALLASFRLLGLAIYDTNNEQHIPLVQIANDPSLYPGDPFMAAMSHYPGLLWRILWVPFRFLPEAPLLVLLTVLQRGYCLYGAGRLARTLAGQSRTTEAVVWCLFAFGMSPLLGRGTVLPRNFEHTSLAVASYLLCLSFVLEGKPLHTGVFFGLVGIANIMHAVHGAIMMAVVAIASPEARSTLKRRRAWLVAFLIMSPAIVLAAQTMRQPRIKPETYLRLLSLYVPQHYLPSSWTLREWILAGLAGTAVLLCIRVAILGKGATRLVLGLTLGHLVLLGAAVAVEVLGSAGWINLQFARSSDLWTPVAAVFVTATVVVTLEKYPQNGWDARAWRCGPDRCLSPLDFSRSSGRAGRTGNTRLAGSRDWGATASTVAGSLRATGASAVDTHGLLGLAVVVSFRPPRTLPDAQRGRSSTRAVGRLQ